MSKHDDVMGHYADVFKGWQVKLLGGKPTREALATIHALGLRPGKQALANALAMRPDGVTGSEIVIACGAPQLNRMRGLISDALVKREAVPPRGGHTVYKLTLTAKGAARIKGAADKAAKADKPKAAKAKSPRKAKPVETAPASEPVASEPVTTDQPQA